jgi:phosphoribosylanthranilate isomerase
LVKVCGTCDAPSAAGALAAAKELGADNLVLGFLVGITHRSKEKLTADDAAHLLRSVRERAYNLRQPVQLAAVTHLKRAAELIRHLRKIEARALDGSDGLRALSRRVAESDPDGAREIVRSPMFDVIQIHDAMPIAEIEKVRRAFPDARILKAVHIPEAEADATAGSPAPSKDRLEARIESAVQLASHPAIDGLLLDSANLAADQIGGTGIEGDWRAARIIIDAVHERTGKAVALAGGLTPDNVARALRETGADMVDANSGYRHDRRGSDWRPTTSRRSAPKNPFAVYRMLSEVRATDEREAR